MTFSEAKQPSYNNLKEFQSKAIQIKVRDVVRNEQFANPNDPQMTSEGNIPMLEEGKCSNVNKLFSKAKQKNERPLY